MPSAKLENVKFTAEITDDNGRGGISVRVYAREIGLDRPEVHAWGLKASHRSLAERLVRAVEAGVVLKAVSIKRDIYRESYLETDCTVLGRTLNADLRRLGF